MNNWMWCLGGMIVTGKPKYAGLYEERPVTDRINQAVATK